MEGTPIEDAAWIEDQHAAARRLDLDRPVDVRESEGVPVAITSGWRRPFLLVGRAARLWAADRRQVVLLHELAHVKRSDWPALLVAEAAVALYWFHPLAQWLGRRVRRDAEQACDELVIASGTKPSVYAAHLLGIFRALGATPQAASPALAIARPHHFEERLRAILDPRASRKTRRVGPAPGGRRPRRRRGRRRRDPAARAGGDAPPRRGAPRPAPRPTARSSRSWRPPNLRTLPRRTADAIEPSPSPPARSTRSGRRARTRR